MHIPPQIQIAIIAAVSLLFASVTASADSADRDAQLVIAAPNTYSLGLAVGDPLGVEFGLWLPHRQWIDLGIGSAGFGSAVFYATYHRLVAEIQAKSRRFKWGISIGGGGLVGGGRTDYWARQGYWGDGRGLRGDGFRYGARFPIGLEFWMNKIPLSLFFQAGPQFSNYFPNDIITAQIGARFHLHARSKRGAEPFLDESAP